MSPFPNITDHIRATIRRIAARRVSAHRGCAALSAFAGITFVLIEFIAPGPLIGLYTARGFFPFGFGWQAQDQARGQFTLEQVVQPLAIFHGMVPFYINNGMVFFPLPAIY